MPQVRVCFAVYLDFDTSADLEAFSNDDYVMQAQNLLADIEEPEVFSITRIWGDEPDGMLDECEHDLNVVLDGFHDRKGKAKIAVEVHYKLKKLLQNTNLNMDQQQRWVEISKRLFTDGFGMDAALVEKRLQQDNAVMRGET